MEHTKGKWIIDDFGGTNMKTKKPHKQINIALSIETYKKLAKKAANYGAKIDKPVAVTTYVKLIVLKHAES